MIHKGVPKFRKSDEVFGGLMQVLREKDDHD